MYSDSSGSGSGSDVDGALRTKLKGDELAFAVSSVAVVEEGLLSKLAVDGGEVSESPDFVGAASFASLGNGVSN
ncbi:MAG: hypothetical protein ACSHX4_10940 [Opitutaceae bacterium]